MYLSNYLSLSVRVCYYFKYHQSKVDKNSYLIHMNATHVTYHVLTVFEARNARLENQSSEVVYAKVFAKP